MKKPLSFISGISLFLILNLSFNIVAHAFVIPANKIITHDSNRAGITVTDPIGAAIHEFRNLSRKERKARIKEVKKQLKEYRKLKEAGEPSHDKVLLVVLAILLPPLAVYLHEGQVNNKFWISLLLTLLFWIPGVIYALVVVLEKD